MAACARARARLLRRDDPGDQSAGLRRAHLERVAGDPAGRVGSPSPRAVLRPPRSRPRAVARSRLPICRSAQLTAFFTSLRWIDRGRADQREPVAKRRVGFVGRDGEPRDHRERAALRVAVSCSRPRGDRGFRARRLRRARRRAGRSRPKSRGPRPIGASFERSSSRDRRRVRRPSAPRGSRSPTAPRRGPGRCPRAWRSAGCSGRRRRARVEVSMPTRAIPGSRLGSAAASRAACTSAVLIVCRVLGMLEA